MLKLKKPDTSVITCKVKEVAKKLGKRNLAIILSVLVIGGAVWLNIALFSSGMESTGASAGVTDDVVDGNAVAEDPDSDGESDAVTDDIDTFFASAAVDRQRSRDEAIEVLQLVVDNPEALDESKSLAMAEISRIAADIDNESKIESLIAAKGFEKCIAVISDANCNVIVKVSSSLLPNQIAQIQEIVYEQAGILPANVKIIEKIA